MIAMATLVSRILHVLLLLFSHKCFVLPDADLKGVESPRAFRVFGDQLVSNLTGIENPAQNIFGRQSCAQGYSQCGVYRFHT